MRSFLALILSWLNKIFRFSMENATPTDPSDEPGNTEPEPQVPEGPGLDRPGPNPGDFVCYYGCPNSKRAQKLQLRKQIYR